MRQIGGCAMRQSLIFGAVLLLSAFAAGQATIVSGYAGNWGPSYGYYVAPFVPLVTTPIVEFGTPSLQVGARNATAGNITGASSITLGSTSGTVVRPAPYLQLNNNVRSAGRAQFSPGELSRTANVQLGHCIFSGQPWPSPTGATVESAPPSGRNLHQ